MYRCLLFTVVLAASTARADEGGLRIGVDSVTDRPNAFIAWRNSQRILEVEVEVENHSDAQLGGYLTLTLIDENGVELASSVEGDRPGERVDLPPRAKGGQDGEIVQVKGTRRMNLLIDELDRAHTPYALAATVYRDGDPQPADRVVKTFNVPSRVRAGSQAFQEYAFVYDGAAEATLAWELTSAAVPEGWAVEADFGASTTRVVRPGESITGYLTVRAGADAAEGSHVDARITARDAASGAPVYQYEWYAVVDTVPPTIRDFDAVVEGGLVRLSATVSDDRSMLKEASGVRAEYSTDDGVTFSSRVMAYSSGNFVGPTSFTAELGPFAPGTSVVGRIVASDIAGNAAQIPFGPLAVGDPGDGASAVP